VASHVNIELSSRAVPEAQAEPPALYASLDADGGAGEATVWNRILGAVTMVVVSAACWAVIGILLSHILR